ncbi:tyrosine-type recombinase/integrase [Nonomuraea sp. NPDC050022]|uniref:tyrosine-type recombinase/integrase n=1 Tax=unclassified Nonomuraea TaxID=2593643 RepID=UPI0033EEE915
MLDTTEDLQRKLFDAFNLELRYHADTREGLIRITVKEDNLPAIKALTSKIADPLEGGSAPDDVSLFVRVALHTGVRIEEAVSAELSALGYERGLRILRITGKGTKPKKRRLPAETGYAIDRYLEDRARLAGVEVSQLTGLIFVTDTGGRFYRSSTSALVTRIGRQAGILAKVTPHVLRHTWASLAAELGADPFEIKEALDHESMDTTMGYVRSGRQLERDPSQLVASALE